MKRITAALCAFGAALALVFFATPAFAQNYPNGQNVSVSVVIDQAATFTLNTTTATLEGIPGQNVSASIAYNVLTNDSNGYVVDAAWSAPVDSEIRSITLDGQPIVDGPPGSAYQQSSHASGPTGDNYTDTLSDTIPNLATGTDSATLTYTLVPS